jgi:hypothetical protein
MQEVAKKEFRVGFEMKIINLFVLNRINFFESKDIALRYVYGNEWSVQVSVQKIKAAETEVSTPLTTKNPV